MTDQFQWLNEPPTWQANGPDRLSLTTGDRTDFWQHTFYGFHRDDGHAYLQAVQGDFTASAIVNGAYKHLYDQAGLMLRIDATHWVKTGIEYTDGVMHFSVVVTGPRSDWSVIPLPDATLDTEIAARLTRHDDAVRVQYAVADGPWRMARLAPFPAGPARAGIMACSPERGGFRASFRDLEIGPPIARALHD